MKKVLIGAIFVLFLLPVLSYLRVFLLSDASLILSSTYFVTYIIALFSTVKKKKVTVISFLPLFHIVLVLSVSVIVALATVGTILDIMYSFGT